MPDEADELMKTLLWTIGLIVQGDSQQKQRIARAYSDAQQFVTTIDLEDGSARPRILACFERFDTYKAAEDVAAAGWMLAALQQRVGERDLGDWEVLGKAIDKAVMMLPPPALH